jgi:hypothetical protein
MRTKIDVPNEIYRALKIKAAHEGQNTVKQIIQRGIERDLSTLDAPAICNLKLPVVSSSRPGTLDLTNEQIDDILASSYCQDLGEF